MKHIEMNTLSAGPKGTMEPGKKYFVDDVKADALVKGRFAKYAGPIEALKAAIKPPAGRNADAGTDGEVADGQDEPEDADDQEKAIHTGSGWYLYQGKKYRKANLPEGAL